ncbi:hypothetical protein D5S17_23710 [Pseudonocardiaceae bacterium YIM PH 21723]|nr:hypothetical protein D5S17_23710 [Pseudonocardiaceae bacterium YIM PH 21723]
MTDSSQEQGRALTEQEALRMLRKRKPVNEVQELRGLFWNALFWCAATLLVATGCAIWQISAIEASCPSLLGGSHGRLAVTSASVSVVCSTDTQRLEVPVPGTMGTLVFGAFGLLAAIAFSLGPMLIRRKAVAAANTR